MLSTAYLAMPMTNSQDGERRHNARLEVAAEAGLHEAGRDAKFPWQLELITGADCSWQRGLITEAGNSWQLELITGADYSTPASPEWSPDAAREWVRRQFLNRVDLLVVIMLRESTGCGRELGLALALGIPTLLLHQEHFEPGVYAGSSKFEGVLRKRSFKSCHDVRRLVGQFAHDEADAIRAQPQRRDDWSRTADPLRRRLLRAWGDLTEAQRITAAAVAHLDRGRLVELLNDPAEFAARTGPLLDLIYALGVVPRPETPATPMASFTPSELDGLARAIDAYDLQPADILEAVKTASGLIAMGGDRRLGLGTPRGWKRILEEKRVRSPRRTD